MKAPVPALMKTTEFLKPFVDTGVLLHAELQVASAVARAVPGTSEPVLLAIALAVRATRLSHVCVVLADVPASIIIDNDARDRGAPAANGIEANGIEANGIGANGAGNGAAQTEELSSLIEGLPWPELNDWTSALRTSEAVATVSLGEEHAGSGLVGRTIRPLVFDGERIYLERYWRFERLVGDDLLIRSTSDTAQLKTPIEDTGTNAAAVILDQLFGPTFEAIPDFQRRAAEATLLQRLVVIAGGPGTGKTRTIARLLALNYAVAQGEGRSLRVSLAAPTGKAAARMTQAVHDEVVAAGLNSELGEPLLAAEASTIHRLLGGRPGHPRHNHDNPVPADLVVIDEASMISLPLMARLLEAVRPDAQLVLVGDPYQLASIESGAVLGDVVGGATSGASGPLTDNVVVLERVHRFGSDSAIAALAAAVRDGDADRAVDVLGSGQADVSWIEPAEVTRLRSLEEEVLERSLVVVRAALEGNALSGFAASNELKVLAATRFGPLGVYHWRDRIERLASAAEPRLRTGERWYVGRPILVTRNDELHHLVNGDTGLVVAINGEKAGTRAVAFPGTGTADDPVDPEGPHVRYLAPSQLDSVDTWWSMTIHKSQGSEYRHAVISLPTAGSPILTRELLYTAITRAKEQVTVVAEEAAIRAAIARPVARATGLAQRLWP